MPEIKRPDPDQLLKQIHRGEATAHRGTLKIFFGACAGVGKTYDMLSDAQQRVKEGMDVVIGIVETHGRGETAELAKGFAQLPRRKISHRGVEIEEFDLDGAIARNPALILIDEHAHTNAPGSRHPKRWQDIEELLERGINVYTTLNVQHLESLNDVVARLTGIPVKETVPDTVFDNADDIVLIDLPTDELLKRLREGKVYVTELVQKRAAEHFFKKKNLVALRELALRRTAERVDAQMGQENIGVSRDTLLTERVMVCIGHDTLSSRVLRHARRMATRMRAPLYAVYVETKRHYNLSRAQQDTVERNLRLAERLGATTQVLRSEDAVQELLNFAYTNSITHLIVGKRIRSRLSEVVTGTLADQLVRQANQLEVTFITENDTPRPGLPRLGPLLPRTLSSYAYATLAIALCSAIAFPLRATTDPDNFTMLYMVGVVGVAARFGTFPAIFATTLSVIAFNFFFIPPYYSFIFHHPQYYLTFSVMMASGIIVGSMAGKLRVQTLFFREREQEIARLYAFTRELATTRGKQLIAECSVRHIAEGFEAEVSVWMPSADGKLESIAGEKTPDIREQGAAEWAYERRQEAGIGTDTLPSARGLYLPLILHEQSIGVIGIVPLNGKEIDTGRMNFLEAFAHILAASLQRAADADSAEQSRVEVESERLRSVLLSSISHDLRTPLASINGLISSLLMSKTEMANTVRDTLQSVQAQASRLSRIVTNLLDITKLELGNLSLNRQPYFMAEVIGTALLHVKDIVEQRKLNTIIDSKSDLIEMDGLLVEQVLVNLIENAIKYTKPDGQIDITVEEQDSRLTISVADNGRGIPDSVQKRIFDKFYTGGYEEGSGSGLGLAICRAIVELHEGDIWVDNNSMGGATFYFTLPRNSAKIKADAA